MSKNEEKQIAVIGDDGGDFLKALAEYGDEFADVIETSQEESDKTRAALPMAKVEHSKTGKHAFYIEVGEDVIVDGLKTLEGFVVAQNYMREFYTEDGDLIFLEIDNDVRISPDDAKNPHTFEQVYGKPKGKIRLFLLVVGEDGKVERIKFKIPGTSIRNWQDAVRKLKRAKIPMIASKCVFTLEDVKDNDYRYAKICPNFTASLAPKAVLEASREWKLDLDKFKKESDEVVAPVAGDTPKAEKLGDDEPLPF